MSGLLTPRDVAALWSCSAGHVRKLCRTGQLRAMRLGADWRISPEAVAEFVAGNSNAAPHPGRSVAVAATRPVLSALPEGGRVLGERWWERDEIDAASSAAGRRRTSDTKRTAHLSR